MRTRPVPSPEEPVVPLAYVALGDVVMLPDGRQMSVRAKSALTVPIGSMAGFVVCGELDLLLSTPATANGPVHIYAPVDNLPGLAQRARVVAEGAARYWAPHLPAIRGAMAELAYRILEVRGSIDPVVLMYRGPEVIKFVKAGTVPSEDLRVLYMDRSQSNDIDVVRHRAALPSTASLPGSPPQALPARPSIYQHFT